MEHGNIILIWNNTIISKFIYMISVILRFITRRELLNIGNKLDHCCFIFGNNQVFEADFPKVKLNYKTRKRINYNKLTCEVYSITAPEQEIKEMMTLIIDEYNGERYGILQLLIYPFIAIYYYLKDKYIPVFENITSGIVCSELICYGIKNVNSAFKKQFEQLNPNQITPLDLKYLFKDNPKYFRRVS